MKQVLYMLLLSLWIMGCKRSSDGVVHKSPTLIVTKISDHTYQHISYLETKDFGKVACNGMLVLDHQEALIVDTPTTEEASLELLTFITEELESKVKGVIPTHFHTDCLGGLSVFHQKQIPSYANTATIAYGKAQKVVVPKHAFKNYMQITIGAQPVHVSFFGEGHTKDNVVAYVPTDKVLFGGCLVKELEASKGNLADANTTAWPATIQHIEEEYPNIQTVIPGHGVVGGPALLTYTKTLFSE